ncbi:hypothetical protein GCM10010978_19410 [Compostibacillus humi]|uniref:Polysaccharide pyruvyl transferase domain-containing protein n=1 Tax=Compostibacillus humi TaxID=1245525 RepID=A0A8J2TMB8_9BACI|nr:polysaccharide pyruvyl transferase family protein [Compostibacillus humi]GFZ77913.1 hypothetical protein GCM10010978_19410 [Compostibacillus humi]
MKYLLLSTYPVKGTRNSGDDLIGKSVIKLLKHHLDANIKVDTVYVSDMKDAANLPTDYKAVLAPVLRPTVKGEEVVPKYRNEYLRFAVNNDIPFIVIGSGWKQYPGTYAQSMNLEMDPSEKRMFKKLFNKKASSNIISSRDAYTENFIRNNGITSFGTTGDPALFDPEYLGLPARLPDRIKTIAVSMPHNRFHNGKTYEMAKELKKRYSCRVILTFHGYYKNLYTDLAKKWADGPIELIDLSGDAEKLNFYNNIDLHVGFRLHAHIFFLRTRKPSLLLAEDGRATGHLATIKGLGYSAAPKEAFELSKTMPLEADQRRRHFNRMAPPNDVYTLLEQEINSGYQTTKKSLQIIDSLWRDKMKPLLELIPY